MLTACWSVKGGSGTTVVAASLAMALARAGRAVTAADFAGDLPVALGLPDLAGPGLRNWLDAGPEVPVDGLERIAQRDPSGITVVPRGEWVDAAVGSDVTAAKRLMVALRALPPVGPVVADCGTARSPVVRELVATADRSLLVLRPCYLALRRAMDAPRPTAVVLIAEPGRSLTAADVEHVLEVPVAAVIEWEPAVARAIDGGLLRTRPPRRLLHALRGVVG